MRLNHALKRKQNRLLSKDQMDKIRRLNRERAKRMEKDVTGKLNGRRTPMSGAGFIKGDGIVVLPHNQGLCVIECKLSSVTNKQGPFINLVGKHLDKLREDTNAMRSLGAKFGILVLKLLHITQMYVVVRQDEIPFIEQTLGITVTPRNNEILNVYNTKGRKFISRKMHMPVLEKYGILNVQDRGIHYVFYFSQVAQWFKQNEEV